MFPSSCNPTGSYVYEWNATLDTEEFCARGFRNRLCSECREKFYITSVGCEACVEENRVLAGCVSVGMLVVIGLFCIEPMISNWFHTVKFARFVFVVEIVAILCGISISLVPKLGYWLVDMR